MWERISAIWKLCTQFYCHTYLWQKFRDNNAFTKEVTKELIWRNFFSVTVNFSFFHTVNSLFSHNFDKNFVKAIILLNINVNLTKYFFVNSSSSSKLFIFPNQLLQKLRNHFTDFFSNLASTQNINNFHYHPPLQISIFSRFIFPSLIKLDFSHPVQYF